MKLKPLNLLGSYMTYIVIIVATFIPMCQGQPNCFPVQPCTGPINDNRISSLLYEISADSNFNFICPRTDVSQWVIRAVVSSSNSTTVDDGTFCDVDITFNSSLVCSTGTGRLAFPNPDKFQDNNGLFTFNFNSSLYNITIPIKYAKPGVFPRQSVIQIVEDNPILLEYFIYSSALSNDYILSRNDGTMLYQNGMPQSTVNFFPNTLLCQKPLSERSDVLQFQIHDPLAGAYTLNYDIYSATVNVINQSLPSPSTAIFIDFSFSMDSPSIVSTLSTTIGSMSKSISGSISESMPSRSMSRSISGSLSAFLTDASPAPSSPSQTLPTNVLIIIIIGGCIAGIMLLVVVLSCLLYIVHVHVYKSIRRSKKA